MGEGAKARPLHLLKSKALAAFDISLLLAVWKTTEKEILYSVLLLSFMISILMLVFPLTLLQIYDRIIPNRSTSTLLWLFIAVLFAVTLGSLLKIVRTYVGAWADAKFEHKIGCKAFDTLLNCELTAYEEEGPGRHLKRITALQMLKQFYTGQALVAIVDIPFVVIFLLLITYIGGWLVIIPLLSIAASMWITYKNNTAFEGLLTGRQDHDDRRLNFILETISKIQTIKSNTMEAQMLRRFERLQKTSTFFDYKLTQRSAFLMSDSMAFSQLAVVLIVAFGGIMVFNGSFTVGALAACTLLSGQCMQPITAAISMWSRMETVKMAHNELEKILDLPVETSPDQIPLESIKGKIEFRNVGFQFSPSGPFLFKGLNFTLNPGEIMCIRGVQSCGKTTLFSLLMQLVKPTEGEILIDDRNLALFQPESIRKLIGYMPHVAQLFKGTIIENLTMFDTRYEERAKTLCKALDLSKIIESFTDGYDTKVATQTTDTLARGIQQQIMIVRALIHDPQIIIFDEADVTIDLEGDQKVRALLEQLKGHHTILIVSHRPSIMHLADKQYELVDGIMREINAQ